MRSYSSSVTSFLGSALALGLAIALSGCAGVKTATDLVDAQAASLQGEITSSSPASLHMVWSQIMLNREQLWQQIKYPVISASFQMGIDDGLQIAGCQKRLDMLLV
mgnify:CR=1 FL=1